ncbi:AAA family ATPase [Streptomyces sp. NPDC006552]|uniref:AAA family ATPase n=1 Tax=Streptomyces sp. NPDC006552 TaxID=3157179 RepID=UPI0033B662BA
MRKAIAGAYAATASAAAVTGVRVPRQRSVRDLRGRGGRTPRLIAFTAGDLVVLSGLPGSGKSTLMRRAVTVVRVDSQDTRERWAARLPRVVPYVLYRPLVRLAHYAGLWRAMRSGASVVVHDCGTQAWVRRWVTRAARRRGAAVHLLLLDVPADTALDGQLERGRGVSRYAFARHRRAVGALVTSTERGELPAGIASAVLLDRAATDALGGITFRE